MKKSIGLIWAALILFSTTSCGAKKPTDMEPKPSQMKAICELSVMDCCYHNGAKFSEEDAQGILWWVKDKHFWIEYSGVVPLGLDISLVDIDVNDTEITITLPEAKVFGCKIDSASLSERSFIVDQNSAKIDAADEVKAFESAQMKLEEIAAADKALLLSAQQRAKDLLEDYITNVGNSVGKEYTIHWIYLDANGNEIGSVESQSKPDSSAPQETTQNVPERSSTSSAA